MYNITLDMNNYFKKLFLYELLKKHPNVILSYNNEVISGLFTDPLLKIQLEHIKNSQNIYEIIVNDEIINNRQVLIGIYNNCATNIIKQYYLFHPEYEEICSVNDLTDFLINSNSLETALKERKQLEENMLEEIKTFFKKSIDPIL